MTKKAHVLNSNEMRRLVKFVSETKNPERDTLMVLISFGLGLRAVEMAALKMSQFYNEDHSINETIQIKETKSYTTKAGKKKVNGRAVYLPSEQADRRIHDALKSHIKHRIESSQKKKVPFSLEQPLFLTQHGTPFTNRSIQKKFESFYTGADIKGASSHSGRRTFATTLIQNGADIKSVSTLMGHSSINMTGEYVQDNPDRLKKMVSNVLSFI